MGVIWGIYRAIVRVCACTRVCRYFELGTLRGRCWLFSGQVTCKNLWALCNENKAAGGCNLHAFSGLLLSCRRIIINIGSGFAAISIFTYERKRIGDYWEIKLAHLLHWRFVCFVCFLLLLRFFFVIFTAWMRLGWRWLRNGDATGAWMSAHIHILYIYTIHIYTYTYTHISVWAL